MDLMSDSLLPPPTFEFLIASVRMQVEVQLGLLHLGDETERPEPNLPLARHGIEPHLARFKAAIDDYSDILLKALADRLAEAFAERLHLHVRTDLWGYAAGEQLTNEALIREQYRGIRPAPGYPACPEHSLKVTLFEMLDAQHATGATLTESFAMLPTAAVSGFYFGHPEAAYFGVARIGQDQLADYAARKGVDVEQATRWLRPNLD